jgi:hypothetical protein
MLKKLKDISLNYSLIVFLIFIGKMIILTPTFADSIIVLVLASLYGYTQYLKQFQPYSLDKEVAKDLLEDKNALSKMNFIQATDKLKDKRYF